MKNDPGERNDLAAREINQVNDLLDWLKETRAPIPNPMNSGYDPAVTKRNKPSKKHQKNR